MKARKSLLVVVASAFLTTALFAQTPATGEKKPVNNSASNTGKEQVMQSQKAATPLKPNLYREVNQIPNLSPEQKQEFNKLRTEFYKLQRELIQTKAEDAKMKSDLEGMMKDHQKKFAEMLKDNKEQSDYYAKNIAGKSYTWEKPKPVQRPTTDAKVMDAGKTNSPGTVPTQPAPRSEEGPKKK